MVNVPDKKRIVLTISMYSCYLLKVQNCWLWKLSCPGCKLTKCFLTFQLLFDGLFKVWVFERKYSFQRVGHIIFTFNCCFYSWLKEVVIMRYTSHHRTAIKNDSGVFHTRKEFQDQD